MGAWGIGPFENDDAADWVLELIGGTDLFLASLIFGIVLEPTDYLEAPPASQAVAAAEVVAAALGRPSAALQSERDLLKWLTRAEPYASPALVDQAARALDRTLGENSELRDLWADESQCLETWKGLMTELRSRLRP